MTRKYEAKHDASCVFCREPFKRKYAGRGLYCSDACSAEMNLWRQIAKGAAPRGYGSIAERLGSQTMPAAPWIACCSRRSRCCEPSSRTSTSSPTAAGPPDRDARGLRASPGRARRRRGSPRSSRCGGRPGHRVGDERRHPGDHRCRHLAGLATQRGQPASHADRCASAEHDQDDGALKKMVVVEQLRVLAGAVEVDRRGDLVELTEARGPGARSPSPPARARPTADDRPTVRAGRHGRTSQRAPGRTLRHARRPPARRATPPSANAALKTMTKTKNAGSSGPDP